MGRCIVFFQLRGYAERRVARHNHAYVETLWRRWAPGFAISVEHRAHVKDTLRSSMPGPIAMYRAGSFTVPLDEVTIPTLYISGADDGCALPLLADGQDTVFTGGYAMETWDGTGQLPPPKTTPTDR